MNIELIRRTSWVSLGCGCSTMLWFFCYTCGPQVLLSRAGMDDIGLALLPYLLAGCLVLFARRKLFAQVALAVSVMLVAYGIFSRYLPMFSYFAKEYNTLGFVLLVYVQVVGCAILPTLYLCGWLAYRGIYVLHQSLTTRASEPPLRSGR